MHDSGSHEKNKHDSIGAAHATNADALRPSKRDLFLAALEIEGLQERARYLDRACEGDKALRGEVNTLLAVEERPGFLDQGEDFEKLNLQIVGGMTGRSSDSQPPLDDENSDGGAGNAYGGVGSFRLVEDRKLKQIVAIKDIHRDAQTTSVDQARFLTEAEVLANLVHPNIVPIYGIVRESGSPLFYSVKLVKGRSLRAILDAIRKEDPQILEEYTLDRLLSVFREVCDAIAFSHSRGIIHRDMKPDNIMIGESGEVLVMNWGIAKKQGAVPIPVIDDFLNPRLENVDDALNGVVMGDAQYMSPERAAGNIEQMDRRSDIFSLGGILYTILTLLPPIGGTTVNEVLNNLTRGEIRPSMLIDWNRAERREFGSKNRVPGSDWMRSFPHSPRGKVPPALSAVVMKALSHSKEDRYEDVESLAAEIESFQQGFPTNAESAGVVRRILLLIKRKTGIFPTSRG